MTAGRHRRDGQRRDDARAWLRSLRTAAAAWLAGRGFPADVRELNAVLLDALPMIPRRATPRAAGGAPATAPTRAGAPEVPALPVPAPGAGASLQLPDAAPGEVAAPASPGAAARRDTWVTWQDPPGTPQVTWSGKPAWTVVSDWRGDWAIEHGSGTVTRAGHWRGGAGRDTIAMPAVADRPRETPYYLAHLAWQDQAAGVIA